MSCVREKKTGSTVTVKKRRAFSAIPDDILQDTRMRTETRLVLGWLVGRPDGWEVRVGHVQHVLGLSRDRWRVSRKEMEKYGYLQQIRRRGQGGSFYWEHIVTDTPILKETTIVEKSNDGETNDGNPDDITTQLNQYNLNTPLNPPIQITSECLEKARQEFQGYSVEALEDLWREWTSKKEEKPRHPDRAFIAWARKYVKNHPLPYGGTF